MPLWPPASSTYVQDIDMQYCIDITAFRNDNNIKGTSQFKHAVSCNTYTQYLNNVMLYMNNNNTTKISKNTFGVKRCGQVK